MENIDIFLNAIKSCESITLLSEIVSSILKESILSDGE